MLLPGIIMLLPGIAVPAVRMQRASEIRTFPSSFVGLGMGVARQSITRTSIGSKRLNYSRSRAA